MTQSPIGNPRSVLRYRCGEWGVIYAEMNRCSCPPSSYEPCGDWACDKELVHMFSEDLPVGAILSDFSDIDRDPYTGEEVR